ncbi:response regulator [Paraburkholderia aromaticivorans]|uniref:response regulator n=1 Tax=Paraburkholderia aromaticivorans TaxID=2026199 RepID=UPI001455F3CB|nr:response regulator [Paraburkholderia aromaticivorans]
MATILLVEDEPDLLFVFQIVLEERGHRVRTARNGKEGLDIASRYLPDLIVTDWNMPEMDGEELCERVRLSPALASVPVAVLSARYPPAEKNFLWNAFLLKPVDVETLQLTVARLLVGRLSGTSVKPALCDPAPSRWQPISWRCWP